MLSDTTHGEAKVGHRMIAHAAQQYRLVRLTELEQEKTGTKWDCLRQRRSRERIALLSVKGRYLDRHRLGV